MKIKKGDKVKVITGKDKGKIGIVKSIIKDKDRIIVEGVNIQKRHEKSTDKDKPKGIISVEGPIHVSNVMIYLDDEKTTSRIGYSIENDKKVRIYKKNNSIIK
jgi:large subunit ribosomal protein L24